MEGQREANRRVVLECIRLDGPLSRAEVARRTGLSLQTVVTIAEGLRGEGVLRDAGIHHAGGRGAPAVTLALDPSGGFTVGLSIDHRRLNLVLVDMAGEACRVDSVGIAGLAPSEVLDLAVERTRRALRAERVRRDRVRGIGVAMPVVFEGGLPAAFGPTSMPAWTGFDLRGALGERLRLPVAMENDATAAAIGERLHGVGRRLRHFFYVYLGAGLGSGLLLDGHPYRGAGGRAGEFGHVIAVPGGVPCSCGARGCLERYVSLAAAQAALDGLPEDARRVEPERLAAGLAEGHPALLAWLDRAGALLGDALRGTEVLLDPEAIIVGGIAPRPLLEALVERADAARRHASPAGARVPPVLIGGDGTIIPALGAAALSLFHTIAP